ncbi:MAG TPA: type II 3-dehydroquinate dehydratase [Firmicutes bacterium]|nr:type II 3-dehydroquinate dehydratase [Bacillota bacterium]
MRILIVHGPNMNLLGRREPDLYGTTTLSELNDWLQKEAAVLGVTVETIQSNHEGVLVDKLNDAMGQVDGLIINAAGLTYSSVSIRDAISALAVPTIEVHITNLARREAFRRHSLLADVVMGQICGLGPVGYVLALRGLVAVIREAKN